MFAYIQGQAKGTFTNEELQSFVNMGWLTQDQYNQLAVVPTATPTSNAAQ